MDIKPKNISYRILLGFLLLFSLFIPLTSFFLPSPLFTTPFSSTLYSREGELLSARVASDGQWRFPFTDSLPYKFKQAIITFEDRRFYAHCGIDKFALARAIYLNLKHQRVLTGASTISMQLVRLATDKGGGRDLIKKVKEAFLTLALETFYTKDEILSLYAANAPFGGNVIGVEAASYRYFGVGAKSLSWAESAMLAVLPNSPALVHPGKNREALKQKRDRLLYSLYRRGTIDSLEYILSIDEPLPLKPHRLPDNGYHYMETLVKNEGMGRFDSNISADLQRRAREIARGYIEYYSRNGINNMALLVLDVQSGEPLVYLGNVTKSLSSGNSEAVDIVRAPRSSGSTLKPLLYMAMLDDGELFPTMLVNDIPVKYKNFTPNNYNRKFEGAVRAHSVVERSLNVPSVRMLDDYGIDKFLLLLRELGFSTLNRSSDHYGLSLILGGGEITLWDLASVYRSLAFALNGEGKGNLPLSNGSIWLTMDALSNLNRPEEEGGNSDFSSYSKVAWKTGTSWGNRDAWSVGVTPEYVVAVWVGNANGEGRAGLTGVGAAAPVMFDIFSILGKTSWFEIPENDLEEVVVCRQSGHPLSPRCGDESERILVPITASRPEPCPYHRIVYTDTTRSYLVNASCYPADKMVRCNWFVLPPAQEWYYMRSHLDYAPLPPLHKDFVKSVMDEGSSQIEILYPKSGSVIVQSVGLDGVNRGVVFKAFHNNGNALLFWYIDDEYIATTSWPEHQILVKPGLGRHILRVVDDRGNSSFSSFACR